MSKANIKQQANKLMRRLNKDCDSERLAAAQEYSDLINKAFTKGRVLRRDIARRLLPIALELLAELDEIEAEESYWDACYAMQQARKKLRQCRGH